MGELALGVRSQTLWLRGVRRQVVADDNSTRIEAETVRRSSLTLDPWRSPRFRKLVEGAA